jgi:uncharacterized protein YdhG (YjbR/CyaY superfamily)
MTKAESLQRWLFEPPGWSKAVCESDLKVGGVVRRAWRSPSQLTYSGAQVMPAKPKTIDEYLAALGADKRAALEKLRKTIRAIAPKAEEYITYQIPAFRLNGKPLVGFGASAKHCAFYPMSAATVEAHKDELKGYDTSKGTIRFQADKPLPAALVRKLVRARIADIEGRRGKAKEPRRAAGKRGARSKPGGSQADPAVSAFLRELDHPLKREIEAVRRIILGVSPEIREGIKWNAPSFATTEFFATVNLRARDRLQLIFHMGAKVKDNSTKGMRIANPVGLIEWLAKERCLVTLGVGGGHSGKAGRSRGHRPRVDPAALIPWSTRHAGQERSVAPVRD